MENCCNTIEDIERQCGGGAAPGLATSLKVICIDNVVSIPEKHIYVDGDTKELAYTITDDIVLEPDTVWNCWNFSKKDNSYVAEPIGEDGDEGWTITVQMFVKKLDPLKTRIFNGTAGGEFLVVTTDKCANQRLLGDKECGGASISVREQTNDKNGYVVTITWTTSYLPCWYQGAIVT